MIKLRIRMHYHERKECLLPRCGLNQHDGFYPQKWGLGIAACLSHVLHHIVPNFGSCVYPILNRAHMNTKKPTCEHDMIRCDMTWHDTTWHDTTWHDMISSEIMILDDKTKKAWYATSEGSLYPTVLWDSWRHEKKTKSTNTGNAKLGFRKERV